ncbi:hypothetical protein Glove_621g54 [Diversispora epigaea]|uniref:Uncharacterized protein n=1 Tax=Diversispora epigaea TaxID=1348612 RepID=A0A397G956_9GLOM|nr:hypothetical protein Glove_621g54 [Diversispora epigaea]
MIEELSVKLEKIRIPNFPAPLFVFEIILKTIGKLKSYLIESKASWLKTHFSFVYRSIFDNNEFSGEIKIWDYVIKWEIAQNSTLPTNLEEWSNKKFQGFENKSTTMFITYPIFFIFISSEDIWEKVRPYEKILEKQLWDDIIQHSMSPNKLIKSLVLLARTFLTPELPSRVNESLSTVINKEHVEEVVEIGTIVVAKVAGTDEIVDGYNPLAWDIIQQEDSNKTNTYGPTFSDREFTVMCNHRDPWWKYETFIVLVTFTNNNFNVSNNYLTNNSTIKNDLMMRSNLIKKSLLNKKNYADMYQYQFSVKGIKEIKDKKRPESWAKITVLLETMDEFITTEWLWFINSSLVISNTSIQVDQVIKNVKESDQVIIGYDCHGLNTDSFFIRNTNWSKGFLKMVYNPELYETLNQEDERTVIQRLIDFEGYDIADKIKFAPLRILNALPLINDCDDDKKYSWHKDDFLFNFYGCDTIDDTNTKEKCKDILGNI